MTREALVEHLQYVSVLTDLYMKSDSAFVERAVNWLSDVEKSLLRLRDPLCSLVASQRGLLLAAKDGVHHPTIAEKPRSRQKAARASGVLVLGRVEEALRTRIAHIDEKLDEMHDKVAQLMALASSKRPLTLPGHAAGNQSLKNLWKELGANEETKSMYNYVGSAIGNADRIYLLQRVIVNLGDSVSGTNKVPN